MEQQTPIAPPPLPQIKDEAVRRAKTRHFLILDLGEGGGGSRISIYFVQDCGFVFNYLAVDNAVQRADNKHTGSMIFPFFWRVKPTSLWEMILFRTSL